MARITGINHVTLSCSDLKQSISFYTRTLGADLRARWATGAYLELGAVWLCLDVGPVQARSDYAHIALDCSISDFAELAAKIAESAEIWKENRSEGASLYFLDPDGHRLELHSGNLQTRLTAYADRSDIEITDPPHPD